MRYTYAQNQLVKFDIATGNAHAVSGRAIIIGCSTTPSPIIGACYMLKPLEFFKGSVPYPNEIYPFECFCAFESQLTPEPHFIK